MQTGTYTLDDGAVLYTTRSELVDEGVAILTHTYLVPYVARFRRFGGRLIFVDLKLPHYTVRNVGIYRPPAGYSLDELKCLYDMLTVVLNEARQANFRIIWGGNFNTVLDVGERGALLDDLVNDLGLQAANDPTALPRKDRQTSCSCMGTKKQIDHIFCYVGARQTPWT